jgi:hypothetical protein
MNRDIIHQQKARLDVNKVQTTIDYIYNCKSEMHPACQFSKYVGSLKLVCRLWIEIFIADYPSIVNRNQHPIAVAIPMFYLPASACNSIGPLVIKHGVKLAN